MEGIELCGFGTRMSPEFGRIMFMTVDTVDTVDTNGSAICAIDSVHTVRTVHTIDSVHIVVRHGGLTDTWGSLENLGTVQERT